MMHYQNREAVIQVHNFNGTVKSYLNHKATLILRSTPTVKHFCIFLKLNLMRKRTKALVSAKPNGTIINRFSLTPDHSRTLYILKELGIQYKDYVNDRKLRSLFKKHELGLI